MLLLLQLRRCLHLMPHIHPSCWLPCHLQDALRQLMASGSENLQEQITPALKAALPQAVGTEVRAWPEQGHVFVLNVTQPAHH